MSSAELVRELPRPDEAEVMAALEQQFLDQQDQLEAEVAEAIQETLPTAAPEAGSKQKRLGLGELAVRATGEMPKLSSLLSLAGSDLGEYLNQIGYIPLLDADQEKELARAIEAGRAAVQEIAADPMLHGSRKRDLQRTLLRGMQAKERLIVSNLRLVVSRAKRYPTNSNVSLEDHIQEGNIGLDSAAEKFDWRRNLKFSTYAMFWIKQAISRGLNSNGHTVHVPINDAQVLSSELRSGADPSQLSDHLRVIHNTQQIVYLDTPVGEKHSATLADLVIKEQGIQTSTIAMNRAYFDTARIKIIDVVRNLPRNGNNVYPPGIEAEVFMLATGLTDSGDTYPQSEIARHFKISSGTISKMVSRVRRALEVSEFGQQLKNPED